MRHLAKPRPIRQRSSRRPVRPHDPSQGKWKRGGGGGEGEGQCSLRPSARAVTPSPTGRPRPSSRPPRTNNPANPSPSPAAPPQFPPSPPHRWPPHPPTGRQVPGTAAVRWLGGRDAHERTPAGRRPSLQDPHARSGAGGEVRRAAAALERARTWQGTIDMGATFCAVPPSRRRLLGGVFSRA